LGESSVWSFCAARVKALLFLRSCRRCPEWTPAPQKVPHMSTRHSSSPVTPGIPYITYESDDGLLHHTELRDPVAPVRPISKLHPGRTVGGVSFGDRTPYHANDESHLEMLALHAFALAADVQLIAAQPVRLSYEFEGSRRRYTPDIFLRTNTEAVLVEVKELHTLLRPEDIGKHAARADAVRQLGGRLCFITDDVLKGCGGALARNLLRLQRHLRLPANDAHIDLTHRLLKNESLNIMDLMLALDQSIGCILNMLAHKRLAFDWRKDITPVSKVSLPGCEFRLLTTAELLNAGEFGDLLAELTLGRVPQDQRRLYRATAPRSVIKIRDPFGNVC